MDSEQIINNKFRNPQGVRYTLGLFYEKTLADKSTVLYTLKDRDHEGYPSLYRLYMEENDLTEYEFANKYLDGWSHWQAIAEATWFKEYITRWREELYLKNAAKRLRAIQRLADTTSRDAFAAQRYLLEKGWVPKEKNTKGRPSKDDIKKEAKHMAEIELMQEEDLQRIEGRFN